MIKAASFPEAHQQRYLLPEYPAVYLDTYITNLIADFRDAQDPAHLDGGQALFAEYGAGIALTHAHPVAQWQVFLHVSSRQGGGVVSRQASLWSYNCAGEGRSCAPIGVSFSLGPLGHIGRYCGW